MDTVGLVLLKWNGRNLNLPLPNKGQSLHDAVARELRIPKARLKLILKGKIYQESESDVLISVQQASNSHIMVIGTVACDQLDSLPNRVAQTRESASSIIPALPAQLWSIIYSILLGIWLFFRSMVVKPERAREGEEAGGVDDHVGGDNLGNYH